MPDLLIQRSDDNRVKKRPRVAVGQPVDLQFPQSGQVLLTAGLAHRENQCDRSGREVAGHERQRPGRGPVQPLRIIHHADQRPFPGHIRHQAQGGQADREAIRAVPVSEAERCAQRVALRTRKAPEPVQERRAQLMQSGERHLDLRLSTRGPDDAATGRALHQVFQQRSLAGSRLAAEDQDPALTHPHVRYQPVQCLALGAPAMQSAARWLTGQRRQRHGGLGQVHVSVAVSGVHGAHPFGPLAA